MGVPLELQQNIMVKGTKDDRVVESDPDIRDSSTDQRSLLGKELLPLHVLGDACAKQENISGHETSSGSNSAYSHIARRITVVQNENLIEINDERMQKSPEENGSTTS